MSVPSLEELHKLIVGDLGTERLQKRLYPSRCVKDSDREDFGDHSYEGFLKEGSELLPLVREDWQGVLDLGTSHREIAQALRNLMAGNYQLHPDYEYHRVQYRTMGSQTCPWGCLNVRGNDHGVIYSKKDDDDNGIMVNTLHPHLIEEHYFFEGKDVDYRLEPTQIVPILLLGTQAEKIKQHLAQALDCQDNAVVRYALRVLQSTSSKSIVEPLIPQLKKLLIHQDEQVLCKTVETIRLLSLRELGPSVAVLLCHLNTDVQKQAQCALTDMDFLTTPIFCDLQSPPSDVVQKLQKKLREGQDIEEAIRSLGKIGKAVPQILEFCDDYRSTVILAVLRIIKNSPEFIAHLQAYHWEILEQFIEEHRNFKDKHNQALVDWLNGSSERPEDVADVALDEENLLLYFILAALRFDHCASVEKVVQLYKITKYSFREAKELFCEYLPQILCETKNEDIRQLVSKAIRMNLAESPLVKSNERFVEILLQFLQQPYTPSPSQEITIDKDLSTEERRERFNKIEEQRYQNAWINIAYTLQFSAIKKQQIASVCFQHIDSECRMTRLQVLEVIKKLRYQPAIDKLIAMIHSEDKQIQRSAIKALAQMGVAAQKAIPALLLVEDKELVADALLSIGSVQGVPFLLDYLEKTNFEGIRYGLYKFESLIDEEVVSVFLKGIVSHPKFPTDLVKVLVKFIDKEKLRAFWQVCNEPQKCQLIKQLAYYGDVSLCEVLLTEWQKHINSSDKGLRRDIFYCIHKFINKDNAACFIPTLIAGLRDDDEIVIQEAVAALKKIDFDSPQAIEPLVDSISGCMSLVRNYDALEILSKINGSNPYGLQKFIDALGSHTSTAISLLKPLGDVACAALYERTQNQEGEKAQIATYGLYQINSPKSISYLCKLLEHSDVKVKTRAALRLCEYKEHCVQAVNVFLDILHCDEQDAIKIALQRLSFLSDVAFDNLREYVVELVFAVVKKLHIAAATDIFFKFGTHTIICKKFAQYREQYAQHPQSFVCDLFV